MAGVKEIQESLLKGVEIMVDSKFSNYQLPKNLIGKVVENPNGYDCSVSIFETIYTCTLPEHLHDWLSKDDMVIVQDIYGDGSNMIIIGSHGSTRKQTLTINDENKGKLVSGVTQFEGKDGLSDHDLVIE